MPASPITNRRVLSIAVPVVISNVTVPLLGLVDTAVVGQIGQAAPIGAVGVGAVILSSLYWIFGFLRMGTTGLVAQAHGRGDAVETAAGLLRALLLALVAGGGLWIGQQALFDLAFRLAPASAEVESLARTYLSIRIWGAPATIGLYGLIGWLIALERTRTVLMIQIVMNALNVVLDLAFVLGLGWGIKGVATASLISEILGAGLGLWFARAAFLPAACALGRLFDRAELGRLVRVNTDIMIRSVLLQASFTTFLFISAGRGDVALAANQVLLQFLQITSFALDGFAFAAESLVGQAVGAGSVARLRRAGWLNGLWSFGFAVLLGVVFALLGPQIINLMARAEEVRALAKHYLPWMMVMPLASFGSYILDGIFIGATQTRAMRNAMIVSVAVYVAALFLMVPLWGNHGLWAALMVLNLLRALSLGALYPRLEARIV
ncbi:MATE family efflux transporter [Thioclava sp. GXIMD4216]|uniref:MATE family efflux transporter n=1 Tax=Thioclava sp. GXIMD4216 TaxID=3131929 RepID=UPI0030CB170A